jgi:hypothetical protein
LGLGLLVFGLVAYFLSDSTSKGDAPSSIQLFTPSSTSVAALGNAIFYEILKENGFKPHRAFRGEDFTPDHNQLLIAPDPIISIILNKNILQKSPLTLIILPKYSIAPDESKPSWLSYALLRQSVWDLTRIAKALDLPLTGKVVFTPPPKAWPQTYKSLKPTLVNRSQLIVDSNLTPLIAAPEGILLGELNNNNRKIYVLADPDLLANHGLGLGENLALSLALIRDITPPSLDVIFDEPLIALKKARKNPDGSSRPFDLPSFEEALIYGHVILAALIAALAAGGRFGPPKRPKDLLPEFGRQKLLINSAHLMVRPNHQKALTINYLNMIGAAAAQARRLPRGLSDSAIRARLERVDPTFSLNHFYNEVERLTYPTAKHCLKWAKDLYDWKARLTRGSETTRKHH